MFEKIESHLKLPKDDNLKKLMQKSILYLTQIIQPCSVTSIATDTRLIMCDTRSELKKWIENNKERFQHQRNLFFEFLRRIQSLQSRVDELV